MPRWWKVGRARTGPVSFARSPDYRGSEGSSTNKSGDGGSSGNSRSKPGTKLYRGKIAAFRGLAGGSGNCLHSRESARESWYAFFFVKALSLALLQWNCWSNFTNRDIRG